MQKQLLSVVEKNSGQDISSCYFCQKCTAGCPVAEFMDYPPSTIHRLLQLGLADEVLSSRAIWLCAGCEVCGARCPNEIDIAKVMDALKQLAERKGIKGGENRVRVMHRVFLSGVGKRGRMHELSLIRDMRLKSGGLFKDMKLGIQMFRKGKLSIFPDKVKNKKPVKQLYAKLRRLE